MKKKILFVAATLIVLSILAAGTLAYFTSRTVVHNVITTGSVDIELVEMMQTADGLVPFENQDGLMPDTDASKIVSVKNTGKNPAYIRVQVNKVITLASGSGESPNPDLVQLDYNTDNWTLRDGYYYYNEAVEPGAETEVLFTTVSFAPEMGNAYQNATVSINIQAQATQVANNGASALEAAGWPA